jgi:F0F1-type ATP synthase gamma subunit
MGFTPAAFSIFAETRLTKERDQIELNNNYFGTVCAVIASIFSKKKFKAQDFFGINEPKKSQTVNEMADFFESLTKALGGELIGG